MRKTARPKHKALFHSINKISLLTQFDPVPPYNQPNKMGIKDFLTHFVGGTEYYYGFTRFNFAKERIVLDAAGILFSCGVVSGVGTALLFPAPESWLVGAAQKSGDDPDGKYLGETFWLAYADDAIVAIVAGQLASLAAARSGPTGPFELSSGVLGVGFLLVALLWKENRSSSADTGDRPSIPDAVKVIRKVSKDHSRGSCPISL